MAELDPGTRVRLLQRKARLEALLPLVAPARQDRILRRVRRLDGILGTKPVPMATWTRGPEAAAGLTGTGGLEFQANAPPGIGRLIRIPFLLQNDIPLDPDGVTTDGGAGLAAVRNATNIANFTGVAGALITVTGMRFATPVISWADLRVVGFQSSMRWSATTGGIGMGAVFGARPWLLVRDLSLGGGVNLFAQGDYIDATVFTSVVPEMSGLRDNPILSAPNQVVVSAAARAQVALGFTGFMTFSLWLVCEVLDDDEYGAHIPGPYARLDALSRHPYVEGDAFVAR
jgi:hypothetical protein